MDELMTYLEAVDFFSLLYNGRNHIPSEIKSNNCGGWVCDHFCNEISTFDSNYLTKLVLLSHDLCVRSSIQLCRVKNVLYISIWKKYERDGLPWDTHPTIESVLEVWRKNHKPVDKNKTAPKTAPQSEIESGE